MNYEHRKIQKALKALMKKEKATYKSIGRTLKVSPATIKRRLNGETMTIQQLTEFANALSISFYELIELSKENKREAHLFTNEQEDLLASDLKLMMVFRLIVAGQSFAQIKARLGEPEAHLRKIARGLEKAGLAQLLAGDRFLRMVQFPVQWQPGGKLEKTYDPILLKNLFRRIAGLKSPSGMNRPFEFALGPEAYQAFCNETERVYLKYRGLSEIHLDSNFDLNHVVSGILFIDRFSIWDGK